MAAVDRLLAGVVVILASACNAEPTPDQIDAPAGDAIDEDAAVDAAIPTKLVAYVSGGAEIAWYDVNSATGALTPISTITAFRTGASFLAHRGTNLYAVASGNRVGAYTVTPATGALTFINDVGAGGTGPTHVSIDATGAYVFVANYNNGTISVFPVLPSGGLGAASQTLTPGANAHMIQADATNRSVFVPCLGANHVAQYRFEPTTGVLTANTPPTVATAAGAGPRHIAFAPSGTRAYVINELDSTMTMFALDAATGRLTSMQTLSTRAAGAVGTNTTAEVVVHPTGTFLYGSNRGDNNIVVFAINATTGMLTLVGHTSTQGMTPRNFAVDPTGTFLYAANAGSNSVVPFRIDPTAGTLTPTAASITVPTPQFVGIFALPL